VAKVTRRDRIGRAGYVTDERAVDATLDELRLQSTHLSEVSLPSLARYIARLTTSAHLQRKGDDFAVESAGRTACTVMLTRSGTTRTTSAQHENNFVAHGRT
jgi:hypothetical protein